MTDFLGKGLSFPFRFSPRTGGTAVSSSTSFHPDHIHESITQILGTRLGERIHRPDFGSRLHELVFEPNDRVLKALLRQYISQALHRWEPRIRVASIAFDDNPVVTDQNRLDVHMHYSIIATNTEANFVYPFYRQPLT